MSMSVYMNISPHTAPTGYGIPKEFFQELASLNIPTFCKAADTASGIYDQQVAAFNHDNPFIHTAVYRTSDPYWEVPEYHLSPKEASDRNWDWHVGRIPPELRSDWIWIETINEPRHDVESADWIGRFMVEHGLKAIDNGMRFCGPGYAGGNPDEGAWETPGMLEYLRLCEQYPQNCAIAIHEYSLHETELFTKKVGRDIVPCPPEEAGRLIGRLTDLVDACNKHNIKVPKIMITEFGWSLWSVPNNPDDAIEQIIQVWDRFYKNYDITAGIWYLGNGWQDINVKVHRMIQNLGDPLKTAIINNQFEVDMCTCDVITDVKTTSLWVPQFSKMTENQISQCLDWAVNGFTLPDGTKTAGEHMMCPSHVDALRIHTAGLPGSVLGVAFPELIGSGVTLEWIQQNCDCALEDKTVVFLGEEQSTDFKVFPIRNRS